MRNPMLSIAAAAALVTGIAATPAAAQVYPVDYGYSNSDHDTVANRRDYRRYDDRRYDGSYGRYDNRGYDRDYRRYDDRRYNYRGNRCDSGTGGTIIGGVVGALAGHELAGRRGDRTAGTLIGGVVGALGGRAIDRSNDRCR